MPAAHHRATQKQLDYIAALADRLDPGELYEAHAQAAAACGYVQPIKRNDGQLVYHAGTGAPLAVEDMAAWAAGVTRRTSGEASALIEAMRAIATVPRAECHCGRRGTPCGKVDYFDDHYDYECGRS